MSITTEELEKLLEEATCSPWRVEEGTAHIWGNCIPDDKTSFGMGHPIAECRLTPVAPWARGPRKYEEAEANARLIALAPDLAKRVIAAEKLAEALRDMADVAGDIPDSWDDDHQVMTSAKHFRVARAALSEWEAGNG